MPKEQIQGFVMGFDFGLKRIGVAIGQTLTQTANPETTLISRDGVPDWTAITQLIDKWQPKAIVVGLPLRLDGTEQDFTQSARKFGQRLNGRYRIPVFYVEEQLSSYEAESRIKSKEAHKSAAGLDAKAAQIILETWLNL